MAASRISAALQRRLARYQVQRTVRTLLAGTGLRVTDRSGGLVITSPAAPRRSYISVEYATGYAFHHHGGRADPLGVLDGCHDPSITRTPVTAQRITTLLNPVPPSSGP